jgi:NNP family nitrate/nitrite transporter-like MFS transporter
MNIKITDGRADKIKLFSIKSPQMSAFHITWMSFLVCFFAWFAIAPLMAVIRDEFHLTKSQIGNIIIASVSITIFARLFFGWLCDKIGPRLSYTGLLIVGSIPVICIGFANSYESFMIFRLSIGVIGASFVITQYHTSRMFASNVVGSANALVGGWGNLGGGLAQIVMPLIFGGFIAFGLSPYMAWRYSMILPGIAMLIMAFVYFRFTQDTPEGNILDLEKQTSDVPKEKSSLKEVLLDRRVWILSLIYGCSFGLEITIDNIASLYFIDKFGVSLVTAGILAGLFGVMNIFARALGGILSDMVNKKSGLLGRSLLLAGFVFCEGLGVMLFSQVDALVFAIITMLLFALFVKMSNGATYSVVPYINRKRLGVVSGIVGAGGNVGAIIMAFVFKMENVTYQTGFFYIGLVISMAAFSALFIVPMFVKKTEVLEPVTVIVSVK